MMPNTHEYNDQNSWLYSAVCLDEDIENDLYLSHHKIDEDHLVISVDQPRDSVYLINLKTTAKFPIWVSYHEFMSSVEVGELIVSDIDYDKRVTLAPELLSKKSHEKIESRWSLIEPLCNDLESVLKNENGQRLFSNIATTHNCTRQHVYNCWYSWLRYGCRKQGLCMPIGKDANRKKKDRHYNVKPGRPNEDIPRGKILDEKDLKIFEVGKRLYGKKNGLSIAGTVKKLWEKYYLESRVRKTDREIELTKTKYTIKLLAPDQRPTSYQFYYWLKKQYGGILPKRDKSRKNATEYASNLQGRSGNAFIHATGPGEIYQLDETPFDEEVVSIFDPERKTPLGKPTLYFVRDTFSRAITGVYITTQNPSYATVKEALFNAARDKSKLLEEHNSVISPELWKMRGLPHSLLVDQAEFNNKRSEGFIEDTNVKILFTQAGRGDSKGLIEKMFDTFSDWFKGVSPAHQTKSKRDIAMQLSRKNACLTIQELYQIAFIFIAHFNNKQKITDYPLHQSMAQDNVAEIPAEIWDWGLKYRSGYLNLKPESELYMSLLEKAEISIHRSHIYFLDKGLKYNCPWILENGYQDRMPSGNKAKRMPCRFHRGLVDIIFICTPYGLKPAYLDAKDQRFEGLSFEEVKAYKQSRKATTANILEDSLNSLVNGQAALENMLRYAQKQKVPGSISKIDKIKDSRRIESMFDRIQQSNRFFLSVRDEFALTGFGTEDQSRINAEEKGTEQESYDSNNNNLNAFYSEN